MDFDILGYVIMDNHYHLMLKNVDAPLKDIMHRINIRFSFMNETTRESEEIFESGDVVGEPPPRLDQSRQPKSA